MKTRNLVYKISLPLLAVAFVGVTGCSKKAQVPAGTVSTGGTSVGAVNAAPGANTAPGAGVGLGGAVSVPGSPAQNLPQGQVATGQGPASVPVVPLPAAPTCFTLSFHHQNLASHNNDETCSHHRNLINIGKVKMNSASLCVKVDEKAVHFKTVKGHADQLLIGPIAGPKSHVTVSYCATKAKCALDCKVVQEKDDFMNAIGADQPDEASENANNGQWDPNEKESDITAHLDSELKKDLGDDGDADGQIFAGWESDGDAASCSSRQAKL